MATKLVDSMNCCIELKSTKLKHKFCGRTLKGGGGGGGGGVQAYNLENFDFKI